MNATKLEVPRALEVADDKVVQRSSVISTSTEFRVRVRVRVRVRLRIS